MTLEQLKQLLQDMTPGPWYAFDMDRDKDGDVPEEEDREEWWSVCSQHGECDEDCPTDIDHCHECITPGASVSEKNAKAIAAMHNALPVILKALNLIEKMSAQVTPRPMGQGFLNVSEAKRIMRELEEAE